MKLLKKGIAVLMAVAALAALTVGIFLRPGRRKEER